MKVFFPARLVGLVTGDPHAVVSRLFAGTRADWEEARNGLDQGQLTHCRLCFANGVLWPARAINSGHLRACHGVSYREYCERFPGQAVSDGLRVLLVRRSREALADPVKGPRRLSGLRIGWRRRDPR